MTIRLFESWNNGKVIPNKLALRRKFGEWNAYFLKWVRQKERSLRRSRKGSSNIRLLRKRKRNSLLRSRPGFRSQISNRRKVGWLKRINSEMIKSASTLRTCSNRSKTILLWTSLSFRQILTRLRGHWSMRSVISWVGWSTKAQVWASRGTYWLRRCLQCWAPASMV